MVRILKGFFAGQTYNNQRERDLIIFGKPNVEYVGGLRQFKGLTQIKLKKLIDGKHINPEGSQNNSPTPNEFLNFLSKNKDYTLGGYTISLPRDDYRVVITDIRKEKPFYSNEEKAEFLKLFGNADTLEIDDNHIYAWFD